MRLLDSIGTITVTILASIILILLSVVYFGLTLLVVKIASSAFFGAGLDANWAVLSAALLSVGAILGGALEKKGR
ncbi:MAG: hypothetical protein ABIA12_00280 [Candidatus Aenigmatarchaeota archaeon]